MPTKKSLPSQFKSPPTTRMSRAGAAGTTNKSLPQKVYSTPGKTPNAVVEPNTSSSNPKTSGAMVGGAGAAAKSAGIYPRYGGNQIRKVDVNPYSSDDLARVAQATKSFIKEV